MKERIAIQTIPAIIWGARSDSAYIYVHGKDSKKEEAESFAAIASTRGHQVLSFDLPEHGERQNDPCRCTVQNAAHDLTVVGNYARGNWKRLSLYACSFGAYFSLLAYKDLALDNCLFLSPVLDMQRLIENMMKWSNVIAKDLQEKGEIPTPLGETLSWAYYSYVRAHPIIKWDHPTSILYASGDHLAERAVVDDFVSKFHCRLEVFQGGEHFFHTKEQVEVVNNWLDRNIR